MAGKKISELTAASTLANSDVFPFSTASETQKASYQLIKQSIIGNGDISGLGASVTAAINALDSGKQDALTFDQTPTSGSYNPVTSGGVANALAAKQDTLTFDTAPTQDSTNPVTSGGVYTAILNAVRDAAYPVGSIYMSVSSTSPHDLFGGTWERIQDRFLLAAGTTYAAGATDGEAMHKLTVQEMPSHTHNVDSTTGSPVAYVPSSGGDIGGSGKNIATRAILATGGGQAHNNMPPYVAVYVWKRTA